jgi:hypothetical protein
VNRRIYTFQEEENEIRRFLDFIDGKEYNVKKHYLEHFLRDKLDPKNKFVIDGYYDKDDRIVHRETDNLSDDESMSFRGSSFQKMKLQVRLENTRDLDRLVKFINVISPMFREISEEEDVNDKRSKILKDILNEPEIVRYNSNKQIWYENLKF